MIESHRNRPGVGGPRSVLSLGLASNTPEKRPVNDHIATLTTIESEQRCDTCAWPDTCAQDRTCWHQEADQDWQRTRLDLRAATAIPWTHEQLAEWLHAFVDERGRVPRATDLATDRREGYPTIETVRRLHGSTVNDFVRSCGYEPHRRQRRPRA